MKRYAIKIGEIKLVSSKPITEDERKEAIQELQKRGYHGAINAAGRRTEVRLEFSKP